MAINSGSFAKALEPGMDTWYGLEYNRYPLEYPTYFETKKTKKRFTEDTGVAYFGMAREMDEGAPVTYDDAGQGFTKTYLLTEYGLGCKITRIAKEDNLYIELAESYAKALANSVRQTRETVAANVLNLAFNSSYTGADSQCLCSASHPNAGSQGGTQSNILSTASDLNEAAVEQMVIDISKITDENGFKIKLIPKRLVIPADLIFDATRVLKSILRPGTGDNDLNALKNLNSITGGVQQLHYLTDTDAFFLTTDCQNGLKHIERRAPNKPEIEGDFDTDTAKFKITYRDSFGWTDWRCIFGTPGV